MPRLDRSTLKQRIDEYGSGMATMRRWLTADEAKSYRRWKNRIIYVKTYAKFVAYLWSLRKCEYLGKKMWGGVGEVEAKQLIVVCAK